jgi:predicted phage tail protein
MNSNGSSFAQVRFYGHLRTRFGEGYPLDVKTPAAAIRALHYVLPGFTKHMFEHSERGYRIIVNDVPIMEDEELHHPAIGKEIKIIPVVAGKAGIGKILGGAALIGLSFFIPPAAAFTIGTSTFTLSGIAFNLGVSMALGGVAQMLAGNPAAPISGEPANNQPSYSFQGPINTSAQGSPVPIAYGTMLVGSQIISSGLQTEQLGIIQ